MKIKHSYSFKAGTVGTFLAITMSAFVVTTSLFAAACNKAGTPVNCGGEIDSDCKATSQNCGDVQKYDGKVTDSGSRSVITGVGSGEEGQVSSKNDGLCTYVCTITSDCAGQSPQVNVSGGHNVVPDGNACTGTSG